jgi:hypothetical protein
MILEIRQKKINALIELDNMIDISKMNYEFVNSNSIFFLEIFQILVLKIF